MKTAILLKREHLHRIFPEDALQGITKLGPLRLFDGDQDPTPGEAAELCRGADAVVTGWGSPRVEGEILRTAPDLAAVFHAAGSVKPVVSPELWARQIRVTNAAKPLGEGVAETTLGMTIATLKNFPNLWNECARGLWGSGIPQVSELYDITVGVVGAGYAGRHYIKLLQAFDVLVKVCDPFLSAEKAREMGACRVELDELLASSDLVSIHAPSIPETRHMIDAAALAQMKRGAILINTSRGSLIDEAALVEHLRAGGLKYACVDVTDPEPPAPDHPLRTAPGALMTPHIAGLAGNGLRRIGRHVQSEMERFARGEPLLSEVREQDLLKMAQCSDAFKEVRHGYSQA